MIIKDKNIILRKLQSEDKHAIAKLADNVNISRNLRDAFPNPYTLEDAENFIKIFKDKTDAHVFGIFIDEEYCGNIGLHHGTDVYSRSSEIGYFIGEEFWNQGIATRAVKLITKFGFEELDIVRIYAGVFEYNFASMKVLEKCGYKKEAILKKAVFKNGLLYDEHRYASINPRYDL